MNKIYSFIAGVLLTTSAFAGIIEAPVIMEAHHPSGVVIQLHDQEGPCVGGARLATYVSADKKQRIQGCFKSDPAAGTVGIVFFDADTLTIPIQVFKPVERL